MIKTYNALKNDVKKLLRLIQTSKDEETKMKAAMMRWETRQVNEGMACIREELFRSR